MTLDLRFAGQFFFCFFVFLNTLFFITTAIDILRKICYNLFLVQVLARVRDKMSGKR